MGGRLGAAVSAARSAFPRERSGAPQTSTRKIMYSQGANCSWRAGRANTRREEAMKSELPGVKACVAVWLESVERYTGVTATCGSVGECSVKATGTGLRLYSTSVW